MDIFVKARVRRASKPSSLNSCGCRCCSETRMSWNSYCRGITSHRVWVKFILYNRSCKLNLNLHECYTITFPIHFSDFNHISINQLFHFKVPRCWIRFNYQDRFRWQQTYKWAQRFFIVSNRYKIYILICYMLPINYQLLTHSALLFCNPIKNFT